MDREVKVSVVYYRVKIERVEPMSAEHKKEWQDTVLRAVQVGMWQSAPREIVTESLSFDADEQQFTAIRRAALEAMK